MSETTMPSTRVFAEMQAEDDSTAFFVRTRNDAKLFSKPDLDKGGTVTLLPKGRVLLVDHCHTARRGATEYEDTAFTRSPNHTKNNNTMQVMLSK